MGFILEVFLPVQKLKEYLDSEGVRYMVITHSPAFTAQEIAAAAHVRGEEMAKTVIVKVDGKLAMVVLPAAQKVDVALLRDRAGARKVEIATESDFSSTFPECELGAMPPFGNLYGIDVYVASRLAEDDEIVFNAGSHIELIRLPYADFERLVKPKVL